MTAEEIARMYVRGYEVQTLTNHIEAYGRDQKMESAMEILTMISDNVNKSIGTIRAFQHTVSDHGLDKV